MHGNASVKTGSHATNDVVTLILVNQSSRGYPQRQFDCNPQGRTKRRVSLI
jgi:hypothetical protein